jgi:hypothetical protein
MNTGCLAATRLRKALAMEDGFMMMTFWLTTARNFPTWPCRRGVDLRFLGKSEEKPIQKALVRGSRLPLGSPGPLRPVPKAKLSQTMTGAKSFLLKAFDPFFRKNGQTELPIKITGSREHPSFGLDFGHKGEGD